MKHCPHSNTAVKQGKAIYAGISNYKPEQTTEAAKILRQSRHALPDSSAAIFDVRPLG